MARRARPKLAIDVRHRPRQSEPVLQHSPHPMAPGCDRRAPPSAVGRAPDIDAMNRRCAPPGGAIPTRRRNSGLPATTAAAGRRLAHQVGGPVRYRQNRFSGSARCTSPAFRLLPFRCIDQRRHMTESGQGRTAPRDSRPDRTPRSREGAGRPHKAPVYFFQSERRQHREERAPMFTHPAVVIHHLVEIARKDAVVARQQRLRSRPPSTRC